MKQEGDIDKERERREKEKESESERADGWTRCTRLSCHSRGGCSCGRSVWARDSSFHLRIARRDVSVRTEPIRCVSGRGGISFRMLFRLKSCLPLAPRDSSSPSCARVNPSWSSCQLCARARPWPRWKSLPFLFFQAMRSASL